MSGNYRELQPDEIKPVADAYVQAWQDATIPEKQLSIVKPELEAFRNGQPVVPYDALVKAVRNIPLRTLMAQPRVLDVGASSGYYREVLEIAGFRVQYRGVDFSRAFKALAKSLYPGIAYDIAHAGALPYADDSNDIVLNSAVIMHTLEYEQVIRETARVAKQYVIFHRTPIRLDHPTTAYLKEGYGVQMLEWHFSEIELLGIFDQCDLRVVHDVDVFRESVFCHRTYLLEKRSLLEREWERA